MSKIILTLSLLIGLSLIVAVLLTNYNYALADQIFGVTMYASLCILLPMTILAPSESDTQ